MQPVDRRTHQRVEVGTPAQPGDELAERLGLCLRPSQGMEAMGLVEQLHVGHPEHVRRLELEDTLHLVEGSRLVDVFAQPVEDRSPAHSALEHHRQPVLVVRRWVDKHHRRRGVLGQVPRRLREELIGERDVLVVDISDAREVGDVRDARRGRRCDDRWDRSFEALAQRRERDALVLCHLTDAPARGPGVWS